MDEIEPILVVTDEMRAQWKKDLAAGYTKALEIHYKHVIKYVVTLKKEIAELKEWLCQAYMKKRDCDMRTCIKSKCTAYDEPA